MGNLVLRHLPFASPLRMSPHARWSSAERKLKITSPTRTPIPIRGKGSSTQHVIHARSPSIFNTLFRLVAFRKAKISVLIASRCSPARAILASTLPIHGSESGGGMFALQRPGNPAVIHDSLFALLEMDQIALISGGWRVGSAAASVRNRGHSRSP